MGEFNSYDHYIYYCGQVSLRRYGSSHQSQQESPKCSTRITLKNDTMISVRFQGKSFNITVIQVYAPIMNVEEAEVEQLCDDLQDL